MSCSKLPVCPEQQQEKQKKQQQLWRREEVGVAYLENVFRFDIKNIAMRTWSKHKSHLNTNGVEQSPIHTHTHIQAANQHTCSRHSNSAGQHIKTDFGCLSLGLGSWPAYLGVYLWPMVTTRRRRRRKNPTLAAIRLLHVSVCVAVCVCVFVSGRVGANKQAQTCSSFEYFQLANCLLFIDGTTITSRQRG